MAFAGRFVNLRRDPGLGGVAWRPAVADDFGSE